MEGRIDVDKYASGVHTMENFQCLVQGPAQKRTGSKYLGSVRWTSGHNVTPTWLQEFVFSSNQAYLIEFTPGYIKIYSPTLASIAVWSNAVNYTVGDVVSSGGHNYYCILAHINQVPPNATYWYQMSDGYYEFPSPYTTAAMLTSVNYCMPLSCTQSGDVLYIANNCTQQNATLSIPPYTLTRYSDLKWVMAPFSPADGPFLEMNQNLGYIANDGIAMYVSGINGSITIHAVGADVFSSTDVGRLVRIQVQTYDIKPWESGDSITAGDLRRFNGNTYKALNTATSGLSAPTNITGTQWDGATNVQWQYMDSGYGTAVITAYTSATQVSADVILQFPSALVGSTATITGITQANPAVVTAANTFSVGDPVFIYGVSGMTQINNKPYTLSAAAAGNFTLSSVNSSSFTAYSSGGTAVKNASVYWQLGAWSNASAIYPGYYPTSVEFYEHRLFWAGGIRWTGSVPDDFNSYAPDFNGQVTTDAAMTGIISAQDVNNIVWMRSSQILIMGTTGGEFGLSAITTTNPLGPDNVHIVRQSKNGCLGVQPKLVGTTILYMHRSGRKLLAMDYNFYIDRYDSTNQTRLAYHITNPNTTYNLYAGTITQIAWQSQPYETLWCVRADGTLVGYTFDKEDNVTGWHRHIFGGIAVKVRSVAVLPNPTTGFDDVYVIVERFINGNTTRFVEVISPQYTYETGTLSDASALYIYADAATVYSSPGTAVLTGLSYLEGQTVSIFADGNVLAQQIVSGGQITINSSAYTNITVGLPYTGKLVTMRIEAGADVGTAQGKTKRVTQATLRVKNTIGGQIGMDGYDLVDIFENDQGSIVLDTPSEPFTGDKAIVPFPGDYETNCRIRIEHSDPTPCTIVAIFPNLQTNEPT